MSNDLWQCQISNRTNTVASPVWLDRTFTGLNSTRRSWPAWKSFHRPMWAALLVLQLKRAHNMPHVGSSPILTRSMKRATDSAQVRLAIVTSRQGYAVLRMATTHTSKSTARARRITIDTVPPLLRFKRQNAAGRPADMSQENAASGPRAGGTRACLGNLLSTITIITTTTATATTHKQCVVTVQFLSGS